MGSGAIMDVGIGLMLMYLVLSLICTVVNEAFATVTKLRANTLKDAIEQLIDDKQLREAFYDHGLMDGAKKASDADHPSYVSGRGFAMALLGSLDPTKPLPAFKDIEDAVRHLPDTNIRDTLLAHVLTADKDLTALRDGVATWFDHAMDRLSGAYKRKLKLISAIVGLAVALILNADTVNVAGALWHDGALREQAVASAARTISSGAPTSPAARTNSNLSDFIADLKKDEGILRPLPVGWDLNPDLNSAGFLGWIFAGLSKIVGLALTTAALSLGAPFWFDLLSKMMNLRGSGEKPDRTPQAISES